MSDASDERPEAAVVPLRLMQGGGTPTPGTTEQRVPFPEDMDRIAALDQKLAGLLVELGKLDEEVIVIVHKKGPLYEQLKEVRAEMMRVAEAAAARVGIDCKDVSKAWTLSLSARVFERTK